MRIGVSLPAGREAATAAAAESIGIPFVHVTSAAGVETAIAAMVAASTASVRIIVSIALGEEHPVTLAEEIAVLDNLGNGRVGVIAELGELAADDAAEDVTVLRASWSGRPVAHRGKRWNVPAGLAGHRAPPAVMVTPPPAQLQIPLWVAGTSAGAVAAALSLPAVVTALADVDSTAPVAPALATLAGDLDTDRQTVIDWATSGVTHLLCALVGTSTLDTVAQWLLPEVAMVGFPRVVAESPRPAPWPRHDSERSDR